MILPDISIIKIDTKHFTTRKKMDIVKQCLFSINHSISVLHHQDCENLKPTVIDLWLNSMSYDKSIGEHDSFET